MGKFISVFYFVAFSSEFIVPKKKKSYNKLKVLTEAIGRCKALTELNLDENKLVLLPASLGEISHLEVLTFNDNELDMLPPEIYNLDNLRFGVCLDVVYVFFFFFV